VAEASAREELEGWNRDYADAMRRVYAEFSDDLDIICLSAEAVMNLTPWKLWDLEFGAPAIGACTEEAIAILEQGLRLVEQQRIAPHPGILHFYIHVHEMSPTPEKALPYADQLRDLCPQCGHLVHMASHIDSLCGHWQKICDEAMPDEHEAVPINAILLVYAKAIAYAALGDLETGRRYQQDFYRRYSEIPDWHIMANNPSRDILAVARAMMNGEVEYHAGNHELGYCYLRNDSSIR